MATATFASKDGPYMLYNIPREEDNKMIRIGRMQMTQKAFIVSVCGIVAFAFVATLGFGLKGLLSASLLLTIYMAYAYSVYCMETGQCQAWSWFFVALVILKTVSLVGLHVAVTMDKTRFRTSLPANNRVSALF